MSIVFLVRIFRMTWMFCTAYTHEDDVNSAYIHEAKTIHASCLRFGGIIFFVEPTHSAKVKTTKI